MPKKFRNYRQDRDSEKPSFEQAVSRYVCLVLLTPDAKEVFLGYKKDERSPSLGCPGGGVESSETDKQALCREGVQEIGYEPHDAVAVIEHRVNPHHVKVVFVALVDKNGFTPLTREPDEINIELSGWFKVRDVADPRKMPHAPYNPSDRKPEMERFYIKENHRNYILSVLREIGRLKEAGVDDLTLEDCLENTVGSPATTL